MKCQRSILIQSSENIPTEVCNDIMSSAKRGYCQTPKMECSLLLMHDMF